MDIVSSEMKNLFESMKHYFPVFRKSKIFHFAKPSCKAIIKDITWFYNLQGYWGQVGVNPSVPVRFTCFPKTSTR